MSILALNVDGARLQELCQQACPESQTLEFKSALPGLSDREKAGFLKEVCALANSDGGDLVYGVAEEDGKASALTPIQGEAADAAKRRLGQVLDAGLEPRVVGLQCIEVPVTGSGYVLIVRVPASFDGPHRYVINGVGRFVMRNGTHTTELTYGQLRAAFDRTATLAERARRFREERITAVADGQTWKPVAGGPICAVHLIPIAAMAGNRSVDIKALRKDFSRFMFPGWGGASYSFNLDGLVVYPGSESDAETIYAFTQVFRTGVLEAARTGRVIVQHGRQLISSSAVTEFFRLAITKFLEESRAFGFTGSAILGLALLHVSNHEFAWQDRMGFIEMLKSDRQHLVLPEVWIDDIESATNVDEVARPLLDMLWQAFGFEQCRLYDSEGRWVVR